MRRIPLLVLLLGLVQATAATEAPQYNRVTLNEAAQTEVENDLLVAVLSAQAEGRDAAAPADEVNRTIDWAVQMVKAQPTVRIQTLGYQTQPIYDKGAIRGWRVQQSLRLEGEDTRLLGELIARLQERLLVGSVGYELSDARRRERISALTALALQRFQARAEHVTQSLHRADYRLVRINIADAHDRPMPLARGMTMSSAAAEAAVAPMRLEAGTQTLVVTVDGEIELSEP